MAKSVNFRMYGSAGVDGSSVFALYILACRESSFLFFGATRSIYWHL
jgi:hypothetical protein